MNPLFSPSSMYWRVNREWLIALAGPRALLLELAHPAVAAGVAQHSNYRGDPFGRLYRTLKIMTELSFGTEDESGVALAHFHKCHSRIRGTFSPSTGGCAMAEVDYDARDPALQFWVLATLIDSVLRVYDRFVTPLTYGDKCAYYDDCAQLARRLGIRASAIPPTYTAFNLYLGGMLTGETLRVTDPARDVVGALFASNPRGWATRLFSFAGIGMLPPRLRDEYGFAWSASSERNLERLAALTRRARPAVATRLAIHPKAYAMEQRFKAHHTPPASC